MRNVLVSVVRGAVSLGCLTLGTLAVGAGSAHADPVRHFEETMTVHCGADTLVLVGKPGSSTVETVNGTPTNSVAILMGIVVTVDGEVVNEFHKPYTSNQDVTVCTDVPSEGKSVVVELLTTPNAHAGG